MVTSDIRISVSVIHVLVCTYQGERFISDQLDSILAQTYSVIEIHVFDDCSTDKTRDIVQEYCDKNSNIYLHINESNLGFLKNFEHAINSTSSNYVALCDQDDVWHVDKLKLSMQALKALEEQYPDTPALIHTDLSLINDLGDIIHPSFFEKKSINISKAKSLSRVMGHCGVMGNTILMNRLLAEKALPFPKGLKYHDYWLALINELYGVRKTIIESLVQYRIHQENTSSNKKLIQHEKKGFDWEKRDYHLPFMDDERELAISYLLEEYKLSPDDRVLVKRFNKYLLFRGGRWAQFIFLLRNDFLKDDLLYRVNVFLRIMFTARYDTKQNHE